MRANDERAVDRFTRRFRHIEKKLSQANRSFEESSVEEMDSYWEEAKAIEAREKSRP
jgi:tetrapyrrole methylase family protein / MazG family protein